MISLLLTLTTPAVSHLKLKSPNRKKGTNPFLTSMWNLINRKID